MTSVRTLTAVALALAFPALAASYDPSFKERPIKALSAEDERGLVEGKGMGFALAAELNGYPGPKHVLELAAQLGLDEARKAKVEAIGAKMQAAAAALGKEIVELEKQLDAAFAGGTIDAASLDRLTAEIAARQGRLRAVHLAAHLETRAVLTPAQIAAYEAARGYRAAEHQHHPGH